jgi:hypothetical protein
MHPFPVTSYLFAVDRTRSALVVLTALGVLNALVVLAVAAPAHGAGPRRAPSAPTQADLHPIVARQPVARLRWSMPPRYAQGWRAWDRLRANYDRSYVRPKTWSVRLDACGSIAGSKPIDSYNFRLSGVGISFTRFVRSASCRIHVDDLPALGTYKLRLIVRSAAGSSSPLRETITLRDWLIVSLGDSMASGEGSPDRPGLYALGVNPRPFNLRKLLTDPWQETVSHFHIAELRPVQWQDKRCHRSALSGHALVASELERRDPHSSVTFVSLACSGAEIRHLLRDPYAGQQPPHIVADHRRGRHDHRTLPPGRVGPQISELAKLVGIGPRNHGRHVDALLLSVGINDLAFSTIVHDCALNFVKEMPTLGSPRCVYDTGVTNKIEHQLAGRYDQLGAALRQTFNLGEVYMTDYPGAPFGSSGACGLLGLPGIGITAIEAQAIRSVGGRFAEEMRRAAARNGWNFVPGMTEAFDHHDYCSPHSYLNKLEQSLQHQGTIDGAVHPNPAGYRHMAALLLPAIVLGRDPTPRWHVKLTIEQLRIGPDASARTAAFTPAAAAPRALTAVPPGQSGPPRDGHGVGPVREDPPPGGPPPHGPDRQVTLRLYDPGAEFGSTERSYTAPVAGRWVDVPSGALTFDLDLYDPPRPPQYPTALNGVLFGPSGTIPVSFDAGDAFGAGSHQAEHPTHSFAVRYRIDVTQLGTPATR